MVALVMVASALVPASGALSRAAGDLVSVIIREQPGVGLRPERLIHAAGGEVRQQLPIISGFAAAVPERAIGRLASDPDIHSVTRNARIRLLHAVDGFDGSTDIGSMHTTARMVGAHVFWKAGFSGQGVDVALIDSGIVPVEGLDGAGKVVNGVDLSFEAGAENLRHLDTYGHGTHLAGIIAGKDPEVGDLAPSEWKFEDDDFMGIAPDARIVNVKVAGHSGATDVSQVIAAIDWVVQHRTSNGLNIRVLNLSFGTDGVQDYQLDPLAYAAEVAWHRGIVVVVAAGNGGYGTAKLNNPAYDPYVIAVGASEPRGTEKVSDDVIPSFSSTGDGQRNPDVVAPGKSIVSLRAPNSYLDQAHPEGRVNARFMRGSGTSQSAAIVSGMAALLIQQRPSITPDAVKAFFRTHARGLPAADPVARGKGLAYFEAGAADDPTPAAQQTWPRATGLGSLELARGTAHVALDDVELVGEATAFGTPWDGSSWSGSSWSGSSWSGNTWLGSSWSGNSWSGSSWSGNTWSGSSWSGNSWSGSSWSGNTWSGNTWSGISWR